LILRLVYRFVFFGRGVLFLPFCIFLFYAIILVFVGS